MIEETRLPDDVMAELSRDRAGSGAGAGGPSPPHPGRGGGPHATDHPRLGSAARRQRAALPHPVHPVELDLVGWPLRPGVRGHLRPEGGCRYGVACSNGTTSLHLALATFGLQPGTRSSARFHDDRDGQRGPLHGRHASSGRLGARHLEPRHRRLADAAHLGRGHRGRPHLRATRSTWTRSWSWPSAGDSGCSRTRPRPTARPTGTGRPGALARRPPSPSTRTRSSPRARGAWSRPTTPRWRASVAGSGTTPSRTSGTSGTSTSGSTTG